MPTTRDPARDPDDDPTLDPRVDPNVVVDPRNPPPQYPDESTPQEDLPLPQQQPTLQPDQVDEDDDR